MSIFKSIQTEINPKTNKSVSILKLNANMITYQLISHIFIVLIDSSGLSMTAVSSITFNNLEARVNYALNHQIQLLKESDQEHRTAVAVDDADKRTGLENCFYYMAKELVFECMVYI